MGKTIVDLDVLDAEKRRTPSKHYVYVILVKWSDGTALTVYRRYSRFFDLQTKLLDHFPIEGGVLEPQKRVIPFLPGKIFFSRSHIKDVAMKRLKDINVYCKSLVKLPPHISACDDVLEFFEVEPDDLDPPSCIDQDKAKLALSKKKTVQTISKPKRLNYYVAIAAYSVQEKGEMSLQPGQKVEVLEQRDSGWWFVNSEDQQGWVPSTYLEPEDGARPGEKEGPKAKPGQEENYICIENFEASSSDEISLLKGSVVQVMQKNMDGWWLVRHKGREAYAPGTYLKKANNVHIASVVEKSRLSGVEIIGSLQDVSNLLSQDAKKEGKPVLPPGKDNPSVSTPFTSIAIVKQRSLERGGSLNPPPRQNSVTKVDSSSPTLRSSIYVTVEDFIDTVGDGLNFQKGQKVNVKEKTNSGWWFVTMGDNEGWVPASYLEPYTGRMDTRSVYELQTHNEVVSSSNESEEEEGEEENWYAEPDEEKMLAEVPSAASEDAHLAQRPLPAIPPQEAKPKTASKLLPSVPSENKPKISTSVPDALQKPALKKVPVAEQKPPALMEHSQRSSKPVSVGGPQDLTAVLKAKFEARSGTSGESGNSSEEDSLRGSKPVASKADNLKPPVLKPTAPPLLPSKPSELKKVSQEVASGNVGAEKQKFSKPLPPAKVKPAQPLVPSKPSTGAPETVRPASSSMFLKPALKPVSKDINQNVNISNRSNVKSMAAVFNSSQNAKSILGDKSKPVKPELASKPKPSLLAKPNPSSKPMVVDQKSAQNVNSLVKNLNGKLSLSQNPSHKEEGHNSATRSSVLEKSSMSPATKDNIYIAKFDFTAEKEGELSFNEGDELEVLRKDGDWCLIRFWDEEGWAPSGYLEKV